MKEKAERDRAERERADREKVERRWKERKEQAAALKAKQLQADHNKHMRDADDHFAQVHQGQFGHVLLRCLCSAACLGAHTCSSCGIRSQGPS